MPQQTTEERMQHIHNQVIETMWIIEDLADALAREPAISPSTQRQLEQLAGKMRTVRGNSATVTTRSLDSQG